MNIALFFIFGVPFLVCLFLLLMCILDIFKCKKARDKQHLMFNQLKKGDYIWSLYDDTVKPFKVESINYKFSYYGGRLTEIEFKMGYDTITIPAEKSKSYQYHNRYTIFKAAKIESDLVKQKRQKQINDLKKVSNETIVNEVNKLIDNLKKIEKGL